MYIIQRRQNFELSAISRNTAIHCLELLNCNTFEKTFNIECEQHISYAISINVQVSVYIYIIYSQDTVIDNIIAILYECEMCAV